MLTAVEGNIFLVVSFQESHAAQVQVIKHDRSPEEQILVSAVD